ncbi:hypothetical protein TNCV_4631381 [Trichonephila clavipes]|nr:hypothetical protein TNCV_4631381 [Trichonephila clavipes]
MSSSLVPLKTRRVGKRCTLNLSRAQTSSRWCGVVTQGIIGRGSLVVKVTDSCPARHELEPSTAEDPTSGVKNGRSLQGKLADSTVVDVEAGASFYTDPISDVRQMHMNVVKYSN